MANPIVVELSKPDVMSDSVKLLKLLSAIKNQLANNCLDTKDVVSPLIKLVASNNASVKTEVCDLIIHAAAKEPDVGLLVVNILNKDVSDPNPAVRSTAITTICSLPVLLPHSNAAIMSGEVKVCVYQKFTNEKHFAGLKDSNPGVRVSAVTGAGKVWRHSPEGCHEFGLVDKLYEMLRDTEPSVVTFSLQTLNVILADEGGVKVNKKMVRYFLTKIVNYREKEFCFLIDFLSIPDLDQELRIQVLNTLDPFLDKKDGNIVLSVARLLTKIVCDNDNLKKSLIERIIPIFCGFLKSSSYREFNPFLIEFLLTLDDEYIEPLKEKYKQFFLRSKDTEKLSTKKVQFLPKLVTEDNSLEILNYLFNLLPQTPKLNSIIFETAAKISIEEKSCYIHCVNNFELILKADCDRYACDILENVRLLKLVENVNIDQEKIAQFARTVLEYISFDSLTPSLTSSVLYLLRNFCKHIPNSPYHIEEILNLRKSSWSTILYSQLLSCSYVVFMQYPPAMQVMIGQVFQLILQQNNHELHEKVMIYYNLLHAMS